MEPDPALLFSKVKRSSRPNVPAAKNTAGSLMRLILFDIDGTLLLCGRQVAKAFTESLRQVYGTCGDLAGYSFAGRTDPGIVLDLMSASGLSRKEILEGLPTMRQLYLDRLTASLDPALMTLLPGVLETLDRLRDRPEVTLGLLTGNWRQGAMVKLRPFDLERYFAFGAFGDDGFDRRDLLPRALERAAATVGTSFDPRETLIVGDSVLDVACGRAHGVSVLAVATGYTSAEALGAAGADWVARDLLEAGDHLPLFAA
jgi:phosphoglycolate phosphatase-like HAD superfamily hydrolase